MSKKKRSKSAIPLSMGERVFEGIDLLILIFLGALMLFPFLNMVAKSFSSNTAITTGKVFLWPVNFQLGTYKYVVRQSQFWNSLKVSLLITIGGTLGSMIVSCLTAYPLSKVWLYGRKGLILFFVFTMLFSGGMVPAYLLMRSLNLINTIWVLFVPFLLSVYNMILLKNFFEEIPEAVEESAQLDGAGNIRILFSIVLPMSLPAMATIGLFYAVGYWDNYMNGLLYITKPELRPLQTYLYQIVTESINIDQTLSMDAQENAALNTEAIRAATIVLACVPIMCVYPFLQKYFVKGMRVGSVKG
ncbi:MAG: carbohydrate ABC transporter permease [Candidatus Faecivicinus sp.]